MLIGEYRHTLDPKGRVNMPARLREELGDSFVITKGLDNCLCIYRMAEWEKLAEQTAKLPTSKARAIQRFIFAGATEVQPDKQGRVLIAPNLRDYAGLAEEVAIIGVSTRVEIWDAARWDAANAELTSEAVAEAMDALDF